MAAKDTAKKANQQMGTENEYGSNFNAKGNAAYNAAFPELVSEAGGDKGYTQSQLAGMNTANQQAAGGSTAGVTGQAGLISGRTRNPGSMAAAVGQATRGAAQIEGQRALGIQEQNAQLAQQKQQKALSELGGLYGTNVKGLSDMMGQANTSLDAYGKYSKSGMDIASGVIGDLQGLSNVGLNSMKMATMA
jgi:hypothetical protein